MTTILQFQELHFSYPGAKLSALNGATLSIAAGQKVVLLGRNGAGKSTLLLHGNGILRPQQGQVVIAGTPLSYDRAGLLAARKQIGMVFQNAEDQLFSASVQQDISFGPLNLGWDVQRVQQQVEEVATFCSIRDLLHRPTHALSGGQKALVALAGVLAMQPAVLLADESLAGLDPWMRAQMLQIFDRLAEQGMAILLSTHDLLLARQWPDLIAFMEAGQVQIVAPPQEFFAQEVWRHASGADLPFALYAAEQFAH